MGTCLACGRNSNGTSVVGIQKARGKIIKDDIREEGKCLITLDSGKDFAFHSRGMGSCLNMAEIWSLLLNFVTLSGPTQSQSKTENQSSSWRTDNQWEVGKDIMAIAIPMDQCSCDSKTRILWYNFLSSVPSLWKGLHCYCWDMETCWVHQICAPTGYSSLCGMHMWPGPTSLFPSPAIPTYTQGSCHSNR